MYLQLACRLVLLFVFAVAVAGKLRSRRTWREFTGSVRDLGIRAARPVAAVTIATEFAVVVSMALPGLVRAGFVLALALLAGLTGGVLVALRNGSQASCRCFGGGAFGEGAAYGPSHVARNAMLGLIAAIGGITGPPAAYEVAGVVTTASAAVIAAIVVIRFADLLSILTPVKTRS
jgi:hypothetical protein